LPDRGHFGRAAQASFVTLSTLSASIKGLEAARAESEPLSGMLRMGVMHTICSFLLPSVLPRARRTYPKLQLYLAET
jgi:LysR family transcriptional regulator, hydrogen peroxide-inducible genes activator